MSPRAHNPKVAGFESRPRYVSHYNQGALLRTFCFSRALATASETVTEICTPPRPRPDMRDEIEAEAGMMRDLAQRAEYDDPGRLSKLSDEDWHMKMRKRGRRRRS